VNDTSLTPDSLNNIEFSAFQNEQNLTSNAKNENNIVINGILPQKVEHEEVKINLDLNLRNVSNMPHENAIL
jgi:hypothetical protein